jgi:ubiquinone/menaquinone biosynthesis C-methylase UbiE
MHKGRAYHDFMLASLPDLKIRRRFQCFACQFVPNQGTVLDFGAGTGIDAKAYAKQGFRVLAYEPCEENRVCLGEHCRDEIANGTVVVTNMEVTEAAHAIVANFAVLNLIGDHRALFRTFDRVLAPHGRVVVNLLNPFYLGDARYPWWRANFGALLRSGIYAVEGDDGPIYRFAPAFIALAAKPAFRRVTRYPRGWRLATNQYLFMAFHKN